MNHERKFLAIPFLLLTILACSIPRQYPVEIQPGLFSPTPGGKSSQPEMQPATPTQVNGEVINPNDFEYLGAFHLPGGEDRPQTFAYGGNAMTYNPDGNSLFIMGHDRMPYGDLPMGIRLRKSASPSRSFPKTSKT